MTNPDIMLITEVTSADGSELSAKSTECLTPKTLRPYQLEAYENFCKWFESQDKEVKREALISFTVGLGKTFTAAACVRRASASGPVLWITHRDELLEQSAAELSHELADSGLVVEIEKAERRVALGAKIVVASISSLHKKRLLRLAADIGTPALIVFDEAHHGIAKTWMAVKHAFPQTKVLNLTATPYRADVRNQLDMGLVLGQKTTGDGIRMGVLVPFRHAATIEVVMSGVAMRLGDFETISLSNLLMQEDIAQTCAEAIVRQSTGRKALVFGASVAHSKDIAERLRIAGLLVAEIYSDTPIQERKDSFLALKNGKINAIVNNMILTEGFNLPEIDLVALLRPTKNAALFLQMLGRGLRSCPSTQKKECLVIDVIDMPKSLGADKGPYLPSDDDARKFASVAGGVFPKATVFLSWFRKIKEIESGVPIELTTKVNTRRSLFEEVFGREPTISDRELLAKIQPVYIRQTSNPPVVSDGYAELFDFMRVTSAEAAIKTMSIGGWKYYPHGAFNKTEGHHRGGGSSETIDLETTIEADPLLKNFIYDIFKEHGVDTDIGGVYHQTTVIDGIKTIWICPLDILQKELFVYLPIKNKVFFRLLKSNEMYVMEIPQMLVRDTTNADLLRCIPDFLTRDKWANLPISDMQKPVVANILNIKDSMLEKAKISRLAASCLITGQSYKKTLSKIYTWVIDFCGD